ncbi:hypothetical protein [Candidatus Pelagisphaera phototrophica]|uniref:hypothetical protein n=1 Tax=Candidatus Pelagisphaera phototrophica TaxID=2684113 RepID=UPI0019FD7D1D|nr:hypothetical protein [Candidatus Pelagisphaera phototrophica]QXD31250.1 hypothetical protein GA004_13030 [Candidatus Pelagisphaera phototrophica]
MKSNTVQILTTVLSNVAVLAGLVFLIFELRQNSDIAMSQARQQRNLNLHQASLANARNHEFSELLGRVYRDHNFDSLSGEEWQKIFLYERANIMNLGNIRFQWNMGLMDETPYNGQLRKAANSEEFWQWLGGLRVPHVDFWEDVDELKNQPSFSWHPFTLAFREWSKDKDPLARAFY